MKRKFFVVIPLLILLAALFLIASSYSAGRKGLGCDPNNEPGVQAGKSDYQAWIDELEKYKLIHKKYPVRIEDLDQNALGIGKGYSDLHVKGGDSYFDPINDRYQLTFYFDNIYVCPIPFSQSRKCTYRSETKQWTCD